MFWIVTFIDTLLDTPVITRVPVKADNLIDAKERASRFVPYLDYHTATPELSDYTAESMLDLLDAGYDALCGLCDGNENVSDFDFQAGIDFYNETWEALDDELSD